MTVLSINKRVVGHSMLSSRNTPRDKVSRIYCYICCVVLATATTTSVNQNVQHLVEGSVV